MDPKPPADIVRCQVCRYKGPCLAGKEAWALRHPVLYPLFWIFVVFAEAFLMPHVVTGAMILTQEGTGTAGGRQAKRRPRSYGPVGRICPRCLSGQLEPWSGTITVDAAKVHEAAKQKAVRAAERGALLFILGLLAIAFTALGLGVYSSVTGWSPFRP